MTFALIMLTLLVWLIAFFVFDHLVLKSFFATKITKFTEQRFKE